MKAQIFSNETLITYTIFVVMMIIFLSSMTYFIRSKEVTSFEMNYALTFDRLENINDPEKDFLNNVIIDETKVDAFFNNTGTLDLATNTYPEKMKKADLRYNLTFISFTRTNSDFKNLLYCVYLEDMEDEKILKHTIVHSIDTRYKVSNQTPEVEDIIEIEDRSGTMRACGDDNGEIELDSDRPHFECNGRKNTPEIRLLKMPVIYSMKPILLTVFVCGEGI